MKLEKKKKTWNVGTIASVYIRYAMKTALRIVKFFLSTIPAKPREWINLEFGWLEVINIRVKNPRKKGFYWIEKFLNFKERERIRKLSDLKGKEIEIWRNAAIV